MIHMWPLLPEKLVQWQIKQSSDRLNSVYAHLTSYQPPLSGFNLLRVEGRWVVVGGGEASPPNTKASVPKVFPNAIEKDLACQ